MIDSETTRSRRTRWGSVDRFWLPGSEQGAEFAARAFGPNTGLQQKARSSPMSEVMVEATREGLSESNDFHDDARWQAVRLRDPAFDGTFFVAVRTTGVYCRPSCQSRPARRENIAFFATAEEAQRAGYRACKRCRPDRLGAPDPQVEAVKRACGRIGAAEEAPSLADLAADAGLSPFHFHRVFKKSRGSRRRRSPRRCGRAARPRRTPHRRDGHRGDL